MIWILVRVQRKYARIIGLGTQDFEDTNKVGRNIG
jgi:hypothetical protein